MKLKLSIIVLFVTFLSLQNLFGQTITISSPANTDVCNEKEYIYSATTTGLDPKKVYYANWIVSPGTHTEGTISGAKVTWKATTTTNSGKLKVELKTGTTVVATSSELNFTIKSIKHIKSQIPMFGYGGGVYTISPCESGTLYLSAADMQVPGTGNPPQEVSNWKWLVPSGWSVDGQMSNGSTMILGNQDVTVSYPASPTEGSIKVQGQIVVNDCSDPQESLASDVVTVKREINFTLSANKAYVLCGETNPVTFTVSPSPACAVYYWNNSQTPSTSNSFQLTPDGTTPPTATVNIVYGGKTATKSKTVNLLLFEPGVTPEIQGSSVICGSNEQYTVSNLRPGYTVSWGSSGSVTRTSAQISYPGVFNKTSTGAGIIDATINTPCGVYPTVLHKNVWAGNPTINYISGPQDVDAYGMGYYAAIGSFPDDNATYNWSIEKNSPLSASVSYSASSNGINVYFQGDGDYWLRVNATNGCGTTTTSELYITSGSYDPYIIFPNPGDDNITLQASQTINSMKSASIKEKAVKSETFEIRILNEQGTSMKVQQTKQLPLNIPTGNLPNGKYIIQVVANGKTWNKQLLIKH